MKSHNPGQDYLYNIITILSPLGLPRLTRSASYYCLVHESTIMTEVYQTHCEFFLFFNEHKSSILTTKDQHYSLMLLILQLFLKYAFCFENKYYKKTNQVFHYVRIGLALTSKFNQNSI